MKSIYLLLVLFALISFSFSSSKTKSYSSPKKSVENFKKYFHYVNLCNRQVYLGKIEAADHYLDSAFSNVKVPFFRDLQKKVIINWKFSRHKENRSLLNLIMKQKHMNSEQMAILFRKDIMAFYKLVDVPDKLSPKQTALKNELELIFKTEQDRLAKNEKMRLEHNDEMIKIDPIVARKNHDFHQLHQAKQFVDMVNKYGFPDENQIGYFIENKSKDAEEKYSSLNTVLDVMINDYFSTKYRNELCKILDKALADHKIHPALYAHLMDHSYGILEEDDVDFFYVEPAIIQVMGTYYKPFIEYNKELVAKLNSNRLRIGLDSMHIEQYQMASTRICADSLNKGMIPIPGYSFIDEYGLGVVMYGFKNDKEKLREYRIDMAKVRSQCNCKEMAY